MQPTVIKENKYQIFLVQLPKPIIGEKSREYDLKVSV